MTTQFDDAAAMELPPGSFGLPILGEIFSFITDNQDFAKNRHERYGSIFKTKLIGFDAPIVYIKGAEANKYVLMNEHKLFVSYFPGSIRNLLGDKAITQQYGDVHQNRRKLLYSAFQPRSLSSYLTGMISVTDQYLEKWLDLQTFTWYPEIQKYTFDIACKLLISLDNASSTPLYRDYDLWGDGLFSFPLPFPWTKYQKTLRSRQRLIEQLGDLVESRKKNPSDSTSDILDLLISEKDENGDHLTFEEVNEQLLTILFAAHGTLASAICSLCIVFGQNKDIFQQAKEEQEQLGLAEEINYEKLQQMPFLDQVIRETLRLFPPVGGGFRKAIQPCSLNGYHIPKGWNVIYQASLTHLDIEVYDKPDEFDPDRFTPESHKKLAKNMSYIPFGGGMRECIGKEYARLEMKLFAAKLLQGYEWDILPNQNMDLDIIPVMKPRDGLKVNFQSVDGI
ncbi:cytochrome P450 (plasmid) [Acaryochloris sp. 'Moss Beach']|nr:cytochrome P450 [Acaryochloris sp. 'Moss Beach']